MNLWIVDDEPRLSQGLKQAFEAEGYEVRLCSRLEELRRHLGQEAPDLVLLDQRLPDGLGLEELPSLLRAAPETRVILMTAYGESPLIVRAIRQGAFDYLDKPFSLEAVRRMVAKARDSLVLLRQARDRARCRPAPLVGSSPALRPLQETLSRLTGQTDLNLLLLGESGSGKEVVARLLHEVTGGGGQFVPLNCAAIPETLLESELFGHRKGAYTGATGDRQGLIELADRGTLFLDEIGDLPPSLQGKLLRFLDTRTLRPLGGSGERTVSLNVVCATCVDLAEAVARGSFRKDLFYRISMLPLTIPPLRERGRDVLELAGFFLEFFAAKRGRIPKHLSPEVEDLFLAYPWPGNVRELKNLMERLTLLADPSDPLVRLKDLPEEMLGRLPEDLPAPEGTDLPLPERLEAQERRCLLEALEAAGQNRTQAARILGISRFSLLRRLQKHDLA